MNINAMNNVIGWASIWAILWAWVKGWMPLDEKTVIIFVVFAVITLFAGLSERAHNLPGGNNG